MFTHNFISQNEAKTKHKQKTLHFYWLFAIISPFSLFRLCFLCAGACLRGTCVNDILLFLGELQSIWMRTLINEYKCKIHDKNETNGHRYAWQNRSKNVKEVTKTRQCLWYARVTFNIVWPYSDATECSTDELLSIPKHMSAWNECIADCNYNFGLLLGFIWLTLTHIKSKYGLTFLTCVCAVHCTSSGCTDSFCTMRIRPNWCFCLCPIESIIYQICHPYVVTWHRMHHFWITIFHCDETVTAFFFLWTCLL